MAKFAIIDSEKIAKDVTYEPPLVIAFGVDKNSVGARTVTMWRTIIPPGGRNPAHHHTCEAAFFVRKGRIKAYIGEERNLQCCGFSGARLEASGSVDAGVS